MIQSTPNTQSATHIVALSGGKDSTAMALRLQELNPDIQYQFVCTPTGNELPEMVEHWAHLQQLLHTRLTVLSSGKSLKQLIEHWRALPNPRQRWCTRILKIEPFQKYVLQHLPAVTYVGIRADETDRIPDDSVDVKHYPLVEWGWTLTDVINYLDSRNVVVPDRTDCAACFYQTIYEWYQLYINHPDYYEQAMFWEDETGHTFRHKDQDSWPTSLRDLAITFHLGYVPKQRKSKQRTQMCTVCAH